MREPVVEDALRKHFVGHRLHELVSASRVFPNSARVDVQSALEKLLPERSGTRQYGIHRQYDHSTLTFSNLMGNAHDPAIIGPTQYEEIDIGNPMPARCLRQALWLSKTGQTPFVLLLSPAEHFAAFDVMEPVRPMVEAYLLNWVGRETLKRDWFFEQRDGNCRLMGSFAIRLSETAQT
jgi:hypothetical protein